MKLTGQKRNIIILYASTLLGVLLGVLSSIINTRFLDPVDYGNVRYVQNIISFIASLLLFGYFHSGSRLLALEKDDSQRRNVKGAMIVILAIASLVLAIGCIVCYILHSNDPIVQRLFLISVLVCFNPLFLSYINTTAQGDNQIGRLSFARILPQLLYVPLAYWIYSSFGATSERMILLQWGGYTIIYILVILSTRPTFANLKNTWTSLKKENKDYGLQLYIGSLVMVATNYLAGISLGAFNSDNSEVGFYTLALTITAPLATLPAIIGTAYFKQFASQSSIPSKVLKASVLMTFASLIAFVSIIRPLVGILYPENYSVVGTYASWLALGYSVHGLGDMINRYLGSHGQGKAIRNSSIINGLFKVFGYIVLVYLFSTNGAILTTIICSFMYTLSLCFYYRKFVSQPSNNE